VRCATADLVQLGVLQVQLLDGDGTTLTTLSPLDFPPAGLELGSATLVRLSSAEGKVRTTFQLDL
jgi:hypothetical protein